MDEVLNRIDEIIRNSPAIIFKKGSPMMPQCDFSLKAAQGLQQTRVKFYCDNMLEHMGIFQDLPRYADWPKFPQFYIGGEHIGGSDITLEIAASGKLKKCCESEKIGEEPHE